MKFYIKEKIAVSTENLKKLIITDKSPVAFDYIECPEYKVTNTPPAKDAGWKPFPKDFRLSGIDQHFWLHMNIKTPVVEDTKEARLSVTTGREGQWDASNPQFTVFVNGKTTQALDTNHTWIPLDSDKEYDIYMYVYTGMVGGNFDVIIEQQVADLKVESLYYDLHVPFICMNELDENSYDYIKIRDSLDKALLLMDFRHVYSEDFYKSVDETAKYLKEEFYEKICGDSESIISCIGHTHIDVAWMWTVAQTKGIIVGLADPDFDFELKSLGLKKQFIEAKTENR